MKQQMPYTTLQFWAFLCSFLRFHGFLWCTPLKYSTAPLFFLSHIQAKRVEKTMNTKQQIYSMQLKWFFFRSHLWTWFRIMRLLICAIYIPTYGMTTINMSACGLNHIEPETKSFFIAIFSPDYHLILPGLSDKLGNTLQKCFMYCVYVWHVSHGTIFFFHLCLFQSIRFHHRWKIWNSSN